MQILLIALVCQFLQSQPPSPIPTARRPPLKQPAADRQKAAAINERGTEQSPVVVKVLTPAKTKEQTANDKAKDLDQSSANWWMVRLTGAIVFVGCVQTIVFWLQARRLKQTIDKMDDISAQQMKDVQASIAEATRSSKAMEGIAESMATNVESVKESVGITREIADRQKLITELQSRAYLSVEFSTMVPQNAATGIRFEPRVAVVNRGNTPAYKVKFSARADVVPFPLPETFPFDLQEIPQGGHGSIVASTMNRLLSAVVPVMYAEREIERIQVGRDLRIIMWGKIAYEDAFGIARYVKFGLTFFWFDDGKTVMSNDTTRHNDSN